MATKTHSTTRAWVEHHGRGCPLPAGTLIDVRHFNGEVTSNVRVRGFAVADDGTLIPAGGNRWDGWDHADGGPLAPKFKAYRLCVSTEQRNEEMFRSWLNVRQEEMA